MDSRVRGNDGQLDAIGNDGLLDALLKGYLATYTKPSKDRSRR